MSAEPTAATPLLWTPTHDKIIAAAYGRLPSREIGRRLGRTAHQVVGRARHLGLVRPVVWSERETALLRRHYRGGDSASIDALVAVLGRSRDNVREKARLLGLSRAVPRWTPEQDDYLKWHFGFRSPSAIGKYLGRSANAVRERAWKLGLRRHAPFTASDAARILGWDWHKVVAAGEDGKLRMARRKRGREHWLVDPDAFERFLVDYCHEIDPDRMGDPSGYYERIVRRARDADPLLTVPEVAARLGVSCDRIRRLIRAGRIAALHAPNAGATGTYLVRASAAHYERLPRGWPQGKARGRGKAS